MSENVSNRQNLPDPDFVDSTDGVRLAIYDLGGDGMDIVFSHATGLCAGVFLPIMRRIPVGRMVALDYRGHGRSSRPNTSMDWAGVGQDALAAVSALRLERPFAVGHSMGGAALVLAEQAAPGTFSGMWLYEPIIFPPSLRDHDGDNSLARGALRRRTSFDNADTAFLNFSSKPPFNTLHPEALREYIRYGFDEASDGSLTLRCLPETESATYEMGIRHDAFSGLASMNTAVTVLRGAEVPMTPSALTPLIVSELPHGNLEEHPELGHFGPLEDPDGMARSIQLAVTASA
ncbi:MAG: alpha/beta hydrolase [Microthrixaceae bacterium]|nr:alpha/beta hydrolase [Microthrixaceae bacterium]